jgi:hypothetical protein
MGSGQDGHRLSTGDAQDIQTQIGNLEQDSFSGDSVLKSEVSVLNKINAAGVLTLRTLLDSNKLLPSLLEQQPIVAKQQRDFRLLPSLRTTYGHGLLFMSLDFPAMRVPDRTDHLQSCIAHRSSNRDSLVERLKQKIRMLIVSIPLWKERVWSQSRGTSSPAMCVS